VSIADEIRKLEELHQSGSLNDEEFAKSKAAVLAGTHPTATPGTRLPQSDDQNTIGRAANRYVDLQVIMTVVGLIIFLVMLFGVILPAFRG